MEAIVANHRNAVELRRQAERILRDTRCVLDSQLGEALQLLRRAEELERAQDKESER
jgi:hypothetical protein